eukprot:CAMPEP_0178971696 /NCGR_PEP_ID=MMETSP0789-20121207/20481_1 /TAXON_ID=3005 /ORGANISM="Rhizosolenia setigera, Strain CCMP 1694" /LENGTH=953 /DNA_ID=CAMNT_0020658821 /DNA_START=120 /DNA_END=2981 /DNA_ORIENTATION=-
MGCGQSKAGIEQTHSPPTTPYNAGKRPPDGFKATSAPQNNDKSFKTPGTSPNSPRADDSSVGSNSSISASSRRRTVNGSGLMKHSVSAIGLDTMDESRREEGSLLTNCVPFELPFGRPIEEVYDGVHDGKILGSGISGLVRLAVHKATGHKYAVKCLELDLVETQEGMEQLREEIYIMCQLDHPNIVRLEEVYESHNEIYLVQQLCEGGELFDRLDEQPDYHYTEEQCARLVKQMLCSVRYIHSKGIVHRDLKLENFLFTNTNQDSELKMIDFGLSKHFKFGEVQHEAVGTPYTVAPEVIRGNYDERCDVWAIGVITYLLLSGDPPFGGCGGPESLMTVRSNILSGKFKFTPEDIWDKVSQQAKDFIKALLVTDPNKRPKAEGAQALPWIKEFSDRENGSAGNQLSPNVVKALVNFKEYSDMKKLLCEVLSFTLLPDQIQGLRKEFEILDKDGSGEISLETLKKVMMSTAGQGSLGGLTESEVEDIFNAMRVQESETTIHWHEFIAAGLSQCTVDDRNLRLAFDRMDSDHKGYITFQNVLDLLGREGAESEERVRRLYFEGLEDCQIQDVTINYDDFLLLMKGQNKSEKKFQSNSLNSMTGGLDSIPASLGKNSYLHFDHGMAIAEEGEEEDAPSMDDPTGTPLASRHSTSSGQTYNTSPVVPSSPFRVTPPGRNRASSLGNDADYGEKANVNVSSFLSTRMAINIPEHEHNDKNIEQIINDESKTPLVVNRNLYRAHRTMRLSVLDASKRFEENQMTRLMKEHQSQQNKIKRGAGLVMRHGKKETISREELKKILDQRMKEQHEQLEKAQNRSGRGKRRRKKTVSDMTGMFGSPPTETTPHQQLSQKSLPKPTNEEGYASCPPSPAVQNSNIHSMNSKILKRNSAGNNIPFMPSIQIKEEKPIEISKDGLPKTSSDGDLRRRGSQETPPSPAMSKIASFSSQSSNFPPPPPL